MTTAVEEGRRESLPGRLLLAVVPRLISASLWLLLATLRVRFVGAEDLFARWQRGEVLLTAFWHNRVLLMPAANRARKVAIMISRSRDGEIATRVMQRWGIDAVRGSASRGGVAGFRQLLRAFRDGASLALVPDGPRGPRYHAKPGIIHLARATGAPLFPVSYAAARSFHLRSWDRLIIPRPFTEVVFLVGEPLQVARGASDEDIELHRQELQARLDALGVQAEVLVRGGALPATGSSR